MGRPNINHREDPTRNRLYRIWGHMKQRCSAKDGVCYRNYTARGIRVCEQWEKDFPAFCEWALSNGYRDDLSIDRIDNDKGYSPDNCRWATMRTQANNTRTNHMLTLNGETRTIAEWSRILNINGTTLRARVRSGFSDKAALTNLKWQYTNTRKIPTSKFQALYSYALKNGFCSTKKDFALQVGVSRSMLHRILTGAAKRCRVETIEKFYAYKRKIKQKRNGQKASTANFD